MHLKVENLKNGLLKMHLIYIEADSKLLNNGINRGKFTID